MSTPALIDPNALSLASIGIAAATVALGFAAVEKRVHVHDLHATILWLLGLDHTRLTYFHQGRDDRLTDVFGNVITEIVA